jgi:hypothetical protein
VGEPAGAWPESLFHSSVFKERDEVEVRRAGCSSAGGATTTGLYWCDDAEDEDDDAGRTALRGLRGAMWMGGSAAMVFSYRNATRLVSSRNDGLSMGRCPW